jgi:mono/diheme cytochrome c family protein
MKFTIMFGLLAALSVGVRLAAAEDGQTLYLQKCAACHQAEGQGLPHPIPPLAGSPILLGDEDELAALLLHGKAGMPAFHFFLNDSSIAAILSYARGAWGNAAPPVAEPVVAAARRRLGDDGFKLPSN